MKAKLDKKWNQDVARQIKALEPVKRWLNKWVNDKDMDWDSQKSAHQAIKLVEMAEYEMWNLQWFENKKQKQLYNEAEDTTL